MEEKDLLFEEEFSLLKYNFKSLKLSQITRAVSDLSCTTFILYIRYCILYIPIYHLNKMSLPALIAFYYVTATEDWTCANVVEYYRSKIEQKEFKHVLDRIKKDLQDVAKLKNDFDATRRRKAQEILDNWQVRVRVV